jgi:hypothetical protein
VAHLREEQRNLILLTTNYRTIDSLTWNNAANKERPFKSLLDTLAILAKRTRRMMVNEPQEVTLMLTMDKTLTCASPNTSDDEIRSSSSTHRMNTLALTVSESGRESPSSTLSGGKRFKLPWPTSTSLSENEQFKRMENEKDAEEFISSISGRSLIIQRTMIEKILNKEKRKLKFGLLSNKLMDLAIRRYSFKYNLLTLY